MLFFNFTLCKDQIKLLRVIVVNIRGMMANSETFLIQRNCLLESLGITMKFDSAFSKTLQYLYKTSNFIRSFQSTKLKNCIT